MKVKKIIMKGGDNTEMIILPSLFGDINQTPKEGQIIKRKDLSLTCRPVGSLLRSESW